MNKFAFLLRSFVLLVLSLGAIGCGAGAANQSGNGPAAANKTGASKNASAYPPMHTGLAQAEFELLDGSKFKLEDKKGKVLVINIWGTWCGPCRAEMPHLVALQDKYRDNGLEVIGLNIGDNNGGQESVELITDFAKKMKLNYTLARSSDASTRQFYQVSKQTVVPQTIITDRELHIRAVMVGGGPTVYDSMNQTVEKIFAE